jgi:hypothetical protein
LLNNSGQASSRGNNSKKADANMMGTMVTDDNQPAAVEKVGIWQYNRIGQPNSAVL